MRAGKLDKTIMIARATTVVDDYGTPSEGWATVATVRAQLVQSSAEEFMRAHGADGASVAIFRIRYLDGLVLADRVTHAGTAFNVEEIKEIGRRRALELRCTAAGG